MPRSTNFEELILNGTSFKKNALANKVEVNSIVAADADNITSVDTRIETEENTRSTEVVSIDNRVSIEESTEVAQVTSIDNRVKTEEDTRSTEVTSIDSRVKSEEDTRSTEVVSIDSRAGIAETDRSNDVVSIDRRILLTQNATQISIDIPVSGNARHKTVNFSSLGFESADDIKVYGALRDGADNNSNPIIYPQISGVDHESVTFIFSDKIPENLTSQQHSESSDYFMDIILQRKADD